MRVLAIGVLACSAAFSQPTAVFTFDVKTARWPAEPAEAAATLFKNWADRCKAVPGGGLVVLDCPAPLDLDDPKVPVVETRLALFRDLDETLRFAGCPDLEGLEKMRRTAAALREHDPDQADALLETAAKNAELCAEVESGRTFSAQIEGKRLLALSRGRQIPFVLFRSEPKPKEISTPYTPAPSAGSLPHAGPMTTRTAEGMPSPEPVWAPAQIEPSLAEPSPAKTSKRAPGPARTSLRTGLALLTCSRGAAEIFIDGAGMGEAPVRTPLIAGRHRLEARAEGKTVGATEIDVDAGDSPEIDVCAPD